MKKRVILLVLIILVGILVRVININSELTTGDKVTFSISQKKEIDENFLISPVITKTEMQPPLYFYLMFSLDKIFGSSIIILKLFSFFFSILSIYLIYVLSKMLFNYKVGLISALILALNKVHIFTSTEARMYSFLISLVLLSFIFFIKLIKQPDKKNNYYYYAFFSILALLTHYSFLGCLVVQNLIFFYKYIKNMGILKRWIIFQFIFFLVFLPYNPIVTVGQYVTEYGRYPEIKFCSIIDTFFMFGTNEPDSSDSTFFFENIKNYSSNLIATVLFILFFILFIVSIIFYENIKLIRKISLNKFLLLLWLFIPILIRTVYVDPTVNCVVRHVLVSSIPFYILVAYGLFKLKKNKKTLLVVIIILSFFLIFTY